VSEVTHQQVRKTALRLLTGREYSPYQLMEKLLVKFFATDIVLGVIKELNQQNLVNEERFIEAYIHSRRERGYGPRKIAQELHFKHRINKENVQAGLELHHPIWVESGVRLLRKRFKTTPPFSDAVSQRLWQTTEYRFLNNHGFPSELIEKIFTQYVLECKNDEKLNNTTNS